MRRSTQYLALVVFCSLATSLQAAAQVREQPPLFVGATVELVIDRVSQATLSGMNVSDDADSTSTLGSLVVGSFLSPRVSVRLEADLPRHGTTVQTVQSTVQSVTTEQSVSHQGQVAVLVGYHTDRRHRVRLGYLAGIGYLAQRSHTTVTTTVSPSLPFAFPAVIVAPPEDLTSTDYVVAPVIGLDADVSIGARASLVPQIRVISYRGGLSVRPGITLVWRF